MRAFKRDRLGDSIHTTNPWKQLMPTDASADSLKRKKVKKMIIRCVVACLLIILLSVLIVPYIKTEILSKNAHQKLEGFDTTNLRGAYAEKIYDIKIFSYHEKQSAEVLYVLGDCEYIVIVELEWDGENDCWIEVDGDLKWSAHGGSAGEGKFYWPFYYGHKILGW